MLKKFALRWNTIKCISIFKHCKTKMLTFLQRRWKSANCSFIFLHIINESASVFIVCLTILLSLAELLIRKHFERSFCRMSCNRLTSYSLIKAVLRGFKLTLIILPESGLDRLERLFDPLFALFSSREGSAK